MIRKISTNNANLLILLIIIQACGGNLGANPQTPPATPAPQIEPAVEENDPEIYPFANEPDLASPFEGQVPKEKSSAQFFVLSGGDSPSGNHYSQYLQTKALFEGIGTRFGDENLSVQFGAGNRGRGSALIADVHKTEVEEKLSYSSLLVGSIYKNEMASKANALDFFKSQISPEAKKLFVIVSDHGMPNATTEGYDDNCINTWGLDPQALGLDSFENRCLTVKELKAKLPTDRPTIYGMSQCFSGGFHQMTVSHDKTSGSIKVNPKVCGFSAAPEDLTASGCTPLVDGPNYKGFERYFTQRIIGKDFITGENLNSGAAKSLLAAHRFANIDDMTTDIPMASSDYYLYELVKQLRSDSIPSQVAKELDFPKEAALGVLEKFSTVYSFQVQDLNFEKLNQMSRTDYSNLVVSKIIEAYPQFEKEAFSTKLADLHSLVIQTQKQMSAIEIKLGELEEPMTELKQNVLNPEWTKALSKGVLADFSSILFQFEKDFVSPNEIENVWLRTSKIMNHIFSKLFVSNPERAIEKSKYLSQRNRLFWKAQGTSEDEKVQAALSKIDELDNQMNVLGEDYSKLEIQYRVLRRIEMIRATMAISELLNQNVSNRRSTSSTQLKLLETCETELSKF